MTITPAGRPAWERANSHETYGGSTSKENFASLGAVNSKTDVDASEYVRLAADVAALQRTGDFAVLVYRCNDTVPGDPTVLSYLAMAGDPPTGARVSDGRVRWTWDAEYPDEYDVEGLINIVGCTLGIQGIGARAAAYELSDPDLDGRNERAEVLIFDDAGAAVPDAVVTLRVSTGQVT
jgi:hypothetical protein